MFEQMSSEKSSKKPMSFSEILQKVSTEDLMLKKDLFEKDVAEFSGRPRNAMDDAELRKVTEDLQAVKDEIDRRNNS